MTRFHVLDVLLALGMTMRLTRVVTTDSIGEWYLRAPLLKRIGARKRPYLFNFVETLLECPFCIGFWIGCGVLLSLWAAGGPGAAWEPWRWTAGALTMNYIAAHVGGRLGG